MPSFVLFSLIARNSRVFVAVVKQAVTLVAGSTLSQTHMSSDTATLPTPHPCPFDLWPISHPYLSYFLLNPRSGRASKEPFLSGVQSGGGVPMATELSLFPGLSRGQSWKTQTCERGKKQSQVHTNVSSSHLL